MKIGQLNTLSSGKNSQKIVVAESASADLSIE